MVIYRRDKRVSESHYEEGYSEASVSGSETDCEFTPPTTKKQVSPSNACAW